MKSDSIVLMSVFAIGFIFALISNWCSSIVAIWIWRILSAGVILFGLYGTLELIVVNYQAKKAKKELFDILMAGQAEREGNRKLLVEGERFNDDDYGYSADNPIMTYSVGLSDVYLKRLRDSNGQPFKVNRAGSICQSSLHSVSNVMVDIYELTSENGDMFTIFVCPYGEQTNHPPRNMFLAEIDK